MQGDANANDDETRAARSENMMISSQESGNVANIIDEAEACGPSEARHMRCLQFVACG